MLFPSSNRLEYAAQQEIIDGILPYRFMQIIIGQFIRQAEGSLYLVVRATHSAGNWSEYEPAALDVFILFNITVCGHSYCLSPFEETGVESRSVI